MTHVWIQIALSATVIASSVIGAVCDARSRRIPNLLTFPVMLIGLALHFAGGWKEGLASLAALAICGLVFLMFYLAGGMGAGDVKLIAAEGCLVGLSNVLPLLALTAIVGGVLAMGYAALQGKVKQTCMNVLALVSHHAREGLQAHPELHVLNAATLRLPYALAIGAGAVMTLYLETLQVSSW